MSRSSALHEFFSALQTKLDRTSDLHAIRSAFNKCIFPYLNKLKKVKELQSIALTIKICSGANPDFLEISWHRRVMGLKSYLAGHSNLESRDDGEESY